MRSHRLRHRRPSLSALPPDVLTLVIDTLFNVGNIPCLRLVQKWWSRLVGDMLLRVRHYCCSTHACIPYIQADEEDRCRLDLLVDYSMASTLAAGPPKALVDLPRWTSMGPVLSNLQHFELSRFDALGCMSTTRAHGEDGVTLARFFSLLDALSWLPSLEVLTISPEEEFGPWSQSGNELFDDLQTLQSRLNKLVRVHTVRGCFGFAETTIFNLFHCLRGMPALRNLESCVGDIWAFLNVAQPSQHELLFFDEGIDSLCDLNLERLSSLWNPSQHFWEEFRKGTHERLTELSVVGLSADATSPPKASSRLTFFFTAMMDLPRLHKLQLSLDYDCEILCDDWEQTHTCPCCQGRGRTSGCTCVFSPGEGNVELRQHLSEDLERLLLSRGHPLTRPLAACTSVLDILQQAFKISKPSMVLELCDWP